MALVSMVPVLAHAGGEATPMIGASLQWSPTDQDPAGMLGIGLEAAWWYRFIGLAIEGSGRAHLDGERAREAILGASLRLRVFDGMTAALMEPRDVEVGIELQAIVERSWWDDGGAADPDVGFGLAVRVRGGGDDGSLRIAESRFFVRVMTTPGARDHAIARATMPAADAPTMMLVLGIGAAFGGGQPRYMQRFRWHFPDWPPR